MQQHADATANQLRRAAAEAANRETAAREAAALAAAEGAAAAQAAVVAEVVNVAQKELVVRAQRDMQRIIENLRKRELYHDGQNMGRPVYTAELYEKLMKVRIFLLF